MSDSDENVPKTKKSAERHVRRRKKRHRKERKSRDKSEASEPEVEVEVEEAFESGNRWPLLLTLVALAFFGLVAYAVWPATELPVRSVVDIDGATGGEKELTEAMFEAVSSESKGEALEYSSESIGSQAGPQARAQAGFHEELGSEPNKESFDTINPESIEPDWIDYSMPDSISEPETEAESDFNDNEDIEDFKESADDVISEENNLINDENFEYAEEHGDFDKNFERNIESSFFGLWQRGDVRKEADEVDPAPEVVHYSDELEERLLTARSIVDSMAKEEKAAGNSFTFFKC